MKKEFLLFVIVLGMSTISFAQTAKENAIKAAEAKQNELLTNLKTIDGIRQIELKNAKGSNQFWIEQGKNIRYGKKKNKVINANEGFASVRKIITNKKNSFEIKDFSYGHMSMSKANPKEGRNGKKDEHTYVIVFDVHKCQTKLYNSYKNEENKDVATNLDACYNLTMTWIVKVNKKKEGKIDAVVLESIMAKTNNDEELLGNLNKELNRLIKEWYDTNVPSYFNKELQEDSIVQIQLVPNQIAAQRKSALQKTVNVSANLPTIQIYVDPSKYMSPDSMYVNNPSAFYSFAPKAFVITFSEDYKHGELSVEFEKGTFSWPKTLSAHERNLREAQVLGKQIKDRFLSVIEGFNENHDAENTKRFKSLFAEKGTVEIAYNTPNGIKREIRDNSKYVNRLKSVKVDVEQANEPMVNVDEDPWTAYIDYIQKSSYGKKCDLTNKRIYLVKDESGAFKIEKIVVEKDPMLCE